MTYLILYERYYLIKTYCVKSIRNKLNQEFLHDISLVISTRHKIYHSTLEEK